LDCNAMFEGLFQPTHLILILVIVLIIFGPGKLTELGKSMGQAVRELRENAAADTQQATSQPADPSAPKKS
jgi:sec-independent protein translocase protein TatA